MNAPWVMDARYMAQLDAEASADLARERRAAEIASDPHRLLMAIRDYCDVNAVTMNLCRALCAIYAAGEQATPEQSLAVCLAVQSLADDAARYEIEI